MSILRSKQTTLTPEISGLPEVHIHSALVNLPNCGRLTTAPNKAVVFGREFMQSTLSGEEASQVSRNQLLAENFIHDMNIRISKGTVIRKEYYESLLLMPAGRLLLELCKLKSPIECVADGEYFTAGTIAGNGALIDHIASRFVQQSSGTLSVAAQSAAPNTYLRCVEFQAIRENKSISGIRIIQINENDKLSVSHLSLPHWIISQKNQWWNYSLNQLACYLELNGNFDITPVDNSLDLARARFIGELHHAYLQYTYLNQSSLDTDYRQLELSNEQARLEYGLGYIERFPTVIKPFTDTASALALARMFIYSIPANAKERQYILGTGSESSMIQFVNDELIKLVHAIEILNNKRVQRQ